MTSQTRRVLLAIGFIVVAGIVRMPLEQALSKDLRERDFLRQSLDIDTRKKLGQGFWAVSLGGLRSLVSTVLNLRAFTYFENKQWTQVAEAYDTIVTLSPETDYYWDTGSWHMAYNAAAYYQTTSELPVLRRQSEWKKWIEKGTLFLEQGTAQKPDSWYLWGRLGWLYSDPNKIVDYEKAYHAYDQAVATGNALPYVRNNEAYALARIPGREQEALDLVRRIQEESHSNVPTMNCLRFTLEMHQNPELDPYSLALDIFGDDDRIYGNLAAFYTDTRKNFPITGIRPLLETLEEKLGVPAEYSAMAERERLLNNPPDPWGK